MIEHIGELNEHSNRHSRFWSGSKRYNPGARAANTLAFHLIQSVMKNVVDGIDYSWGGRVFVPPGVFYLNDDLHIIRALELFGTGLQGESVLKFPAGKSLIIDGGDGTAANATRDGSECVIRDLQIISEEEWVTNLAVPFNAGNFDPPALESTSKKTPGIWMGTSATVQRVYIKGFTGTGIRVKKIAATNCNQWRIHDVFIESCGGHSIHIGGHGGADPDKVDPDKSETQGGLCSGAKIFTVEGNGIYDGSFGGNTFVGCYVEETKGRGYSSEAQGQVSFIGCFAEAMEPTRLAVGGSVWVGGSSGKGFTDDTVAFIVESYGNVHPFQVPNLASIMDPKDPMNPEGQIAKFGKSFNIINLLVGFPNDLTDPTTLYAWGKYGNHNYVVRWDEDNKIWATENAGVPPVPKQPDGTPFKLRELSARNIATYLTGLGHPRDPWLQGFGEMLLGPANGAIKITTAANVSPAANDLTADRHFSGKWQLGDRIYDPALIPDKKEGWICVQAGDDQPDNSNTATWRAFGSIE